MTREVLARLCWMAERPLLPGARLLVKHNTRTAPARIEELVSVVTIETLDDRPSPDRLELNDLALVRLRLAEPLAVDPYKRVRGTGAFILIDEATFDTVGAGMVVEASVTARRRADPYRDLQVIDSRAPRTNQAVVGLVSVLALATGWWWLLALLALQLALGLTLGRRFCLPCLALLRGDPAALRRGPARGFAAAADRQHGRLRRFSAPLGRVRGRAAARSASGSALLVAALALLAAITGFCTGCEAYKLACLLRGRPFVSCPLPPEVTA